MRPYDRAMAAWLWAALSRHLHFGAGERVQSGRGCAEPGRRTGAGGGKGGEAGELCGGVWWRRCGGGVWWSGSGRGVWMRALVEGRVVRCGAIWLRALPAVPGVWGPAGGVQDRPRRLVACAFLLRMP